jgi:hypothetical protein
MAYTCRCTHNFIKPYVCIPVFMQTRSSRPYDAWPNVDIPSCSDPFPTAASIFVISDCTLIYHHMNFTGCKHSFCEWSFFGDYINWVRDFAHSTLDWTWMHACTLSTHWQWSPHNIYLFCINLCMYVCMLMSMACDSQWIKSTNRAHD